MKPMMKYIIKNIREDYSKKEITLKLLKRNLDIQEILYDNSSKHWDGGYVLCGLTWVMEMLLL